VRLSSGEFNRAISSDESDSGWVLFVRRDRPPFEFLETVDTCPLFPAAAAEVAPWCFQRSLAEAACRRSLLLRDLSDRLWGEHSLLASRLRALEFRPLDRATEDAPAAAPPLLREALLAQSRRDDDA